MANAIGSSISVSLQCVGLTSDSAANKNLSYSADVFFPAISVTSLNTNNLYNFYKQPEGTTSSDQYRAISSNAIPCIAFGSGTTPASVSDVSLDTILKLPLTNVSCSRTGTNTATLTVVTTVTNDTGAPVTISEYGLHSFTTSGGSAKYPAVCFTRTVLETPITLAAEEARTVSLTINFNNMLEQSDNS